MADYLHGAYGAINENMYRVPTDAPSAMVVVGTAPVHALRGVNGNVNKPVVVHNMAEAKAIFGYSDEWESFTLCEAFHTFFEVKGVGPLVCINVLDPYVHRVSTQTSKTATPAGDYVRISNAQYCIMDTIAVTGKVYGTDYTADLNMETGVLTLKGHNGSLGTAELTIKYNEIDMDEIEASTIVGEESAEGMNTGLYAIRNVYQETGMIPAYLIAPGWSTVSGVAERMAELTQKVNGHWDMWNFIDMPILDPEDDDPLPITDVANLKTRSAYDAENSSVYWPMAVGTDDRFYHLATLAAANFLELLAQYDGIPYHSASNTAAPIIKSLANTYSSDAYPTYPDDVINLYLNKHGINSAAFVGGKWVIWGAHAADYDEDNQTTVNVAETNRMMLYYISNDFQRRRPQNIDKPMTKNDIHMIVSEEQNRLDSLKAMGALIFGEASVTASAVYNSDVLAGDFAFEFRVTATPLAKSLTAVVTWVDDGFAVYFE